MLTLKYARALLKESLTFFINATAMSNEDYSLILPQVLAIIQVNVLY